MHIAMFTETYIPQVNGAVTSINAFSEELMKRGHEVEIFAPSPGPKEYMGIQVHRFKSIPFPPYPEFRASPFPARALSLVKKGGFDLIHTHGPFFLGWAGYLASKMYKIPSITTFHTPVADYVPYLFGGKRGSLVLFGKKVTWTYTRAYYNRFKVVLSPSNAVNNLLRKHGIRSKLKIIKTGVKLKKFDKVKKTGYVRGKFAIFDHPFMIHAGRLSYEKNVDTILRAFREFSKSNKEMHLVITSRGPLLNQLKGLAKQLQIHDRVHFTGYVEQDDLIALFKEAEFAMIASDADTQGLVILEEMACGLPVIGADCLAIPETIRQGYNGMLFKLYNHKDLAKKMQILASDKKLRNKMSKNARKTAEENTIEIWTDRLLDVYELITKEAKKGRSRK